MRISDWSSDVCSSDLLANVPLTLPTESLMNGLSTRTPENSSNPTSIDKKMTTSRIVGSHAFSSSRKALTRVNVTTGTIREEAALRSEEHTSELQSLMRRSYAVFSLKKKKKTKHKNNNA